MCVYVCVCVTLYVGVGTNVAEGAIAPPLFYRKKENALTCFADSKTNGIECDWQYYYTVAGG